MIFAIVLITAMIDPVSDKQKLLKLQRQWYDILELKGFKDIEWTKGQGLNSMNSPLMKDTAFRYKKKYNEHTAQHYRLMQNFATNFQFKRKMDQFIFNLYCDGIPFREIVHKVYRAGWNQYIPKTKRNPKPKYISKISLFTLHHILKKYIKLAYEWNRTHPEGMLLASDEPQD